LPAVRRVGGAQPRRRLRSCCPEPTLRSTSQD